MTSDAGLDRRAGADVVAGSHAVVQRGAGFGSTTPSTRTPVVEQVGLHAPRSWTVLGCRLKDTRPGSPGSQVLTIRPGFALCPAARKE